MKVACKDKLAARTAMMTLIDLNLCNEYEYTEGTTTYQHLELGLPEGTKAQITFHPKDAVLELRFDGIRISENKSVASLNEVTAQFLKLGPQVKRKGDTE